MPNSSKVFFGCWLATHAWSDKQRHLETTKNEDQEAAGSCLLQQHHFLEFLPSATEAHPCVLQHLMSPADVSHAVVHDMSDLY